MEPPKSSLPTMTMRDILSPSATLMGFIIASISFLLTNPGNLDTDSLISFLLIAIFFILCAALLTVLTSIFKSETLWILARTFYAAGWSFFIIILIVGVYSTYVEGNDGLLPDLDKQIIIGLISISISSISLIQFYVSRKNLRKEIKELYSKITSRVSMDEKVEVYDFKDYNMIDAFITTTIQLEKLVDLVARTNNLRVGVSDSVIDTIDRLYAENIIHESTKYYAKVVFDARNRIMHGDVPLTKEIERMTLTAGNIYGDLMDTE